MAITTLSIVATVFVGNLYETKDRPVPGWAHTILLYYAARILGFCNSCVDEPLPPGSASYSAIDHCAGDGGSVSSPIMENGERARKNWHRQPSFRLVTLLENPDCTPRLAPHDINSPRTSHGTDDEPETAERRHKNGDSKQVEHHGRQQPIYFPAAETAASTEVDARGSRGKVRLLPRPADEPSAGVLCPNNAAPATVKPYAKDWAKVAAVCDRLFFWLCFALTVGTTVMLFHPLMWREQNSLLAA